MEVYRLSVITQKGFSPMEIAKMLGVSHATIYREIEKGKLSSVKVGARRVITQWDLEAYLGKERADALLAENNEKKFDELSDQERFARIDAVMGMFAHIPGSVDDFMMEKQKDIEVENRRWKEKE
ncbi:TPA: DNA-binding protein [bacterium]|jgi:excisionase family DNA binding protein|nr:DNA-binding protein [bacterium]